MRSARHLVLAALATIPLSGMSHAQTADPAPDARLLTDFADGGLALQWFPLHDTVMGGRSDGAFKVADGRLRFTGRLNTNGGGFASIRTRDTELGLANHVGVHLRVRGDGRQYSLRLQQSGETGRQASYGASFRTTPLLGDDGSADVWQDVYLPFADFVPTWRGRVLDRPAIDPARINMFGVTLADKIDGPYAIELDRVTAWQSFDLDSHRNRHRVLVLAADDAADLDLLRQLRALGQTTEELADRDLLVVVLLEKGRSRAGGLPIEAATAARLRDQLGFAPGRFSTLLLGKDGGEKSRQSGIFETADLFAQIDAMPMRRAELARRAGER